MPENRFKIPNNYYKHRYSTNVSTRYAEKLPKHRLGRIVLKLTSYSARLYFGYYAALAIGILFSAWAINTSGIAKTIMDGARSYRRQEQLARIHDQSALIVYAEPSLAMLLLFPNGHKVGETAEGVRFFEASKDVIFSTSLAPQNISYNSGVKSFRLTQIPATTLTVTAECKSTGTYVFTLEAIDRSGLYKRSFTRTVDCLSPQARTFNLAYNPDTIDATKLIP